MKLVITDIDRFPWGEEAEWKGAPVGRRPRVATEPEWGRTSSTGTRQKVPNKPWKEIERKGKTV